MMRRYLLAAGLAVAVTGVAGPAYAAWQSGGTGTATATAARVQAPASASAAPTPGATSTSLTVSWTAPASGPAPTGYRVDRVSPAGTVCTMGATTLTCNDTGLTAGTAYSYRVTALVSLWNGTAQSAAATTAVVLTLDALTSPATTRPTFTGGCSGTSMVTVTVTPTSPTSPPTRTLSVACGAAGAGRFSIKNSQGAGINGPLTSGTEYDAVATQGATSSNTIHFTA